MLQARRSVLLLLAALMLPGTVRAQIVINEIMYNSSGTPDVEYVELVNAGTVAQDLTGWYLLDDNDDNDPAALVGTLAPGAFLVVAGTNSLFTFVYPTVTNFNPNDFGGGFGLGNTSDVVRLFDASDTLVDWVPYETSAPWPVEADGDGSSLELISPALDNALGGSWAPSAFSLPQGTPGVQNTAFVADLPPAVVDVLRDVSLPTAADSVTVTARVFEDQALSGVDLFVDSGTGFQPQAMADDGLSGDGPAGDGVFGSSVPSQPSGTVVRYYVSATDDTMQTTTEPPTAPADFFGYTIDYVPPELRITEIVAANQTGVSDPLGDKDDWAEIANPGPDAVSLAAMFLSPDRNQPRAWMLPPVVLEPGDRVLIWCDNEIAQGPFHAGFTLPRGGGELWIFDSVVHGNVPVVGGTYGLQGIDIPFGLSPEDADAPEYLSIFTPNGANDGAAALSAICINELFASSQVGVPDWVELYNRGTSAVDIGGWNLSDDNDTPDKYEFPPGTMIAPGQFLSLDESQLGFGLSASGTDVLLLTSGAGEIGRDYFDFGPQFADVSQGRFPDGSPNWHFFSAWTLADANDCDGIPGPGPVVELHMDSDTTLRWQAVGSAGAYDAIKGDLGILGSGAGLPAAVTGCLENNSRDVRSWDPAIPVSGNGYFYVVRAVDSSCGFGTFDTGSPSQPQPRDGQLVQCP